MNEFEPLYSKMKETYSLTSKESEFFMSHFKKRSVRKKQFVIQPDFIAQYRFYIVKGAFRAFVIGKDGQEHVISLAIEDWWITDPNSLIYQQPATMFVEALEDSVILQLDHKSEMMLKSHSHKYESFFRTTAERGLAYMQRRLIAGLTMTAEERYEQFAEKYPDFLQRVPQYIIASHLGMTTQYLSRIRKENVKS